MKQPSGGRSVSKRDRAGRAPINTYYSARGRDTGSSPFQRRSAPGRGARKIILGFLDIILVVLLFAGLIYSLIVSPKPKIIVNSTQFHSVSQYQAEASKLLSPVKNRNKITFDQNSVSAGLKKKFPEIISADVELPIFSQQPTLRLDISTASLRLKSGGSEYIVDSQGAIASGRTALPFANKLPQVTDQSGFTA
ncbi:MAG TPA: hypothetical protein VFJ84_03205, partial [Candidatus Saccharimonadales bacterium]|nr:hypothetical protein [Candidatus Saccharimonadales bacterium]